MTVNANAVVKIKDVPGALIDKNKCPTHGLNRSHPEIGGCNCYEISIENATIDLQGNVGITLNRERLARRLFEQFTDRDFGFEWDLVITLETYKGEYDFWLKEADAILADLQGLIEVVK